MDTSNWAALQSMMAVREQQVKAALHQRPSRLQVRVVDQTTRPSKCHIFVGLDRQIGSSPPAQHEHGKGK